MFSHLSPGYLESFHMPEYEQPFSNGVMGLFLVFINMFQENGILSLQLIELILEEDDFLVFLINVHGGQAFEASFTNSARVFGCDNGCLEDEGNSIGDGFDVVLHTA